MKQKYLYFLLMITLISCESAVKKENTVKDEVFEDPTEVTKELEHHQNELSDLELEQLKIIDEVGNEILNTRPNYSKNDTVINETDIIGYWVGDFENAGVNDDDYYDKIINEGNTSWNRTNKINIAVVEINNGKAKGYSVVAGNHRPFEGTVKLKDDTYYFELAEPGDDVYDGEFTFSINKNSNYLKGTWNAYKKIDIPKRKYKLQKEFYQYNPDQMLEHVTEFANWNKKKTHKNEFGDVSEEELKEYIEYWGEFYYSYSSATDAIYKINASNTLLKKEDVENLYSGDLLIIRNTIYARHGYSFKDRSLRRFFDRQDWYIPLHNNIKTEFTSIELKNIELLLKYEKNATEYYDTFGR